MAVIICPFAFERPEPVIRALPLRLVPPPPAEKVERHITETEAVAEVRRALNVWAYTSEA